MSPQKSLTHYLNQTRKHNLLQGINIPTLESNDFQYVVYKGELSHPYWLAFRGWSPPS